MLTWLGIGAQRSGTTWFTEMLLQHPNCSLGRSGKKELHILDRAIVDGDLNQVQQAFADEFSGLSGAVGEWTPAYLRALWAAEAAASVLDPQVVLVLLRDPIERFHSAVRLNKSLAAKRRIRRVPDFVPSRAIEALWGSSYLPQLEEWAHAVGRERMLVLQYEAVVQDPQAAVAAAWQRMGLDAVPVEVPPASTSQPTADGPFEVDRAIARHLAPQLRGLEEWGIDLQLWTRLGGNL